MREEQVEVEEDSGKLQNSVYAYCFCNSHCKHVQVHNHYARVHALA